jgi:hypothetical protein
MNYGKNGPWHKNIAVGLLMFSSVVPTDILLMNKSLSKIPPIRAAEIALAAFAIIGAIIILRSLVYNFRRQNHCVALSRSLDTLLDAGKLSLPEYVRNQTLLAAELERLDSLTKP